MRLVWLALMGTGCAYISDKHEAWRLDPDEDGVDISSDCDDGDGELGLPREWYLDQDEDGFGALEDMKKQCTKPAGYVRNPDDCDDTDPNVSPDAEEVCDERDNNCDLVIDEGVTKVYGYLDADSDGYGDPATEELVCELRPNQVENGEDCDDSTSTWQFQQPIEVFYNGIDDNCSADDLDGDQDADGFWLADYESVVLANGGEPMLVDPAQEGDCDDIDPGVNPNAIDEAYDGIDTDCAGNDDYDHDGDGYVADEHVGLTTLGVDGSGALPGGDCNDLIDTVNPEAIEDCATEYDDDCDGSVSAVDAPSCTLFYKDYDGDAHGGTESRCQCVPDFEYGLSTSDDCNDFDGTVYPGAFDPPHDGVDADCLGDDDYDYDDDGFVADEYVGLTTTGVESSGILPGGDCDDSDAAVHPEAIETCATLADDDCDGFNNEQMAEGCTVYYFDEDADGYGRDEPFPAGFLLDPTEGSEEDSEDSGMSGSDSGASSVDSGDSVEDSGAPAEDSGISVEDSGSLSEDSGASPEDTGELDGDSGGLPSTDPVEVTPPPSLTECWCEPVAEYRAEVGGDCNDTDASVNPGVVDVPYDAMDTDCGFDDDFDQDGDGYAKRGHEGERTLSGDGESYVEGTGALEATDCDDTNPLISPAADELCDTLDNDCDDEIDEPDAIDAMTLYWDADGDGFGIEDINVSACAADGYVALFGDCDDESELVYPGAPEECDDVDQDCDGDLVGDFSDMDDDSEPDCMDPPFMDDVATHAMTGLNGSDAGQSLHIDAQGRLAVGAPVPADGSARVHLVSALDIGMTDLEMVPTQLSGAIGLDSPEADTGTLGPDTGTMEDTGTTGSEVLFTATGFGRQVSSMPSVACEAGGTCDSTGLVIASPLISAITLIEEPETGRTVSWPSSSGGIEIWMMESVSWTDDAQCGNALAPGIFSLAPETDPLAGMAVSCTEGESPSVYVVQQPMFVVSSENRFTSGSRISEGSTETSEGFGQTLVVGDFNDDGFDDVVVGAPTSSRNCAVGNCGAVHVFQGPQMDETTIEDALSNITGDARNDRLGLGLAVGDMDGDGTQDLLVGTDMGWSGSDPKKGAVLMFAGSTVSAGGELTEVDAFHTVRGSEFRSEFGTTIAVVPDMDGDLSPELLVGAPKSRLMATQAGAVYGLLGPWTTAPDSTAMGGKVLHGKEVLEFLGTSIAVGDVGTDGIIDILVGAPGSDTVYGMSAVDWFTD